MFKVILCWAIVFQISTLGGGGIHNTILDIQVRKSIFYWKVQHVIRFVYWISYTSFQTCTGYPTKFGECVSFTGYPGQCFDIQCFFAV